MRRLCFVFALFISIISLTSCASADEMCGPMRNCDVDPSPHPVVHETAEPTTTTSSSKPTTTTKTTSTTSSSPTTTFKWNSGSGSGGLGAPPVKPANATTTVATTATETSRPVAILLEPTHGTDCHDDWIEAQADVDINNALVSLVSDGPNGYPRLSFSEVPDFAIDNAVVTVTGDGQTATYMVEINRSMIGSGDNQSFDFDIIPGMANASYSSYSVDRVNLCV